MARYFASNALGVFPRNNSASSEVTTAGRFDANYVDSAMSLPGVSSGPGAYMAAVIGMDATSVTDLWARFDLWSDPSSNSNNLTEFVNTAGAVVARLTPTALNSGAFKFQYWGGSAFVDVPVLFFIPARAVLNTIALHVTCGASGTIELWCGPPNSILPKVMNMVAPASMNAAFDNIAEVRLINPGSGGNTCFYSQIMLADFDLRATHFSSNLASASGTFNDGTGAYTDTNSQPPNFSLFRVLPASGNKFSMAHAARVFPANTTIDAVQVNAAVRVSGGVVTKAKAVLVQAATAYYSGNLAPTIGGGYDYRGAYFAANPATSAAWTQSTYNTAEFGIQAQA